MEITRDCKSYEDALLPDEQVEWAGAPERLPLLTSENKRPVLLRWICCAFVFVALTAAYTGLMLHAQARFNVVVELVLFAACAFAAYLPVQDWLELQKKTRYYVTNKRVILAVGKNVYALNRSGIKAECKRAEGGAVHILWGSCVGMPARKYRRAAVMPLMDDADLSQNGFVFYHVKEGKAELEALFSV